MRLRVFAGKPVIVNDYPGINDDCDGGRKTKKRISILTPRIVPTDLETDSKVILEDSNDDHQPTDTIGDSDDTKVSGNSDTVTIDYDMSDEELFNSIKEQLNSIADKYKDLLGTQLSFQGLFGWLVLKNIIFKHGREGLEEYLNDVFQEIEENIRKTAKDRENRQYVILADGSVFIVEDNSSTNYYKYWKVYYDTIRVPACQNIFHMIREQKHVVRRYSYVSGPTQSLPDEDYWVESDYCVGYEMHETINVFWKEGDVFYGDKPLAANFPTDTIDPLGEAFEKMKASLGTITDDGKYVKVKQPTSDEDGLQVATETTLPASFFTQPHTLHELVNLGLIIGDFNTNELNRLLGPSEVDFIIEIYGVKK